LFEEKIVNKKNVATSFSSWCPIEIIIIFYVLPWFVVCQAKSFYHPYIVGVTKELGEKNLIEESEGAYVITVLKQTIPLLIVKGTVVSTMFQ